MLCNSQVKFGAFREFLAGTFPGRFDRIASGHYAALSRPDETDRTAKIDTAVKTGETHEPVGAGAEGDSSVKLVMSGDAHKAGGLLRTSTRLTSNLPLLLCASV